MKPTVAGAVLGAILIVLGVMATVISKSASTETVKEIQIDMQNQSLYYTDYFQAKQHDIAVINVSATKRGAVPASLRIEKQETNEIVFGDVEGTLFQFDVSLPSDGTYRVRISNYAGGIYASGTVTQRRVPSYFSQMFDFGAGMAVVGALVTASGLSVYGYQQMKLKRKMEKTRVCPSCNQSVPKEKIVCPHCGFDVTKSVRCKYCSSFYDRSLAKCPNCGAKKS